MAFSISDTIIHPGERKFVMIRLPDLYHSEPVFMPTHVIRGIESGPVLLVTAAIHGDEINGTEIVRRLLKMRALNNICGTLICVPVVNVFGFLFQSRYLMDRRDLNRSFPGSSSGSIAARLAKLLVTELISKASHIIDLHTGALHRTNVPHIRASLNEETLKLAKAFNAPVILDTRERDGSLRQIASDLKKPLLLYETGEALRFDESGIRLGVRGIMGTMAALGMIKLQEKPYNKIEPTVVSATHWIRAEVSGNLQVYKKLGSVVNKGEVIGSIANPFDLTVSDVRSPIKGILIGYSKIPPVHEGQALFHLALLERVPIKKRELIEHGSQKELLVFEEF